MHIHRYSILLAFIVLLPRSAFGEEKNDAEIFAPSADKSAATSFVSIFDGKTFEGWEGNLNVFRIEDGAVVGGTLKAPLDRNYFLCTKKSYSDFEMRFQCKLLGKGANGGVQIRSQRIPNNNEVRGYQADMADDLYWGCLFDESRRGRILAGPSKEEQAKIVHKGDWNGYVIRCNGRRIQLWVNGHQTVDYTEPDTGIPQTGIIGLQIHGGGPSETWYKDVRIKDLTSGRTNQ